MNLETSIWPSLLYKARLPKQGGKPLCKTQASRNQCPLTLRTHHLLRFLSFVLDVLNFSKELLNCFLSFFESLVEAGKKMKTAILGVKLMDLKKANFEASGSQTCTSRGSWTTVAIRPQPASTVLSRHLGLRRKAAVPGFYPPGSKNCWTAKDYPGQDCAGN